MMMMMMMMMTMMKMMIFCDFRCGGGDYFCYVRGCGYDYGGRGGGGGGGGGGQRTQRI